MDGFPRVRADFASKLFVAIIVALVVVPTARPASLFRDFTAFYCAGEAIRGGADPYRAEPLGGCERLPEPKPIIAGTPGLAMPAPLPPYALLPFSLLSLVPFVPAVVLWLAVLCACIVVSIWALHRATGVALPAAALVLGLSDGYASLCLGQIAPIAVAAVAVSGWLLAKGRDRTASIVAACAMIEPHIGLPLCLALFLFRGRTRLPLVAIACACLAVSVASGPGIALEYFRDVLPAHALSEVSNEKQLSLTYVLHRFGIADGWALRFGDLWYATMLVLGVACAGRIARTTSPAAIAFIPPALAVFGGPFVHIVQIAAAFPAALFFYAYGAPRSRRVVGIAIVALAIPWIQFSTLGNIFYVIAPIVVHLTMLTFVTKRPIVGLIAGGAALVLFALAFVLIVPVADPVKTLVAAYDPKALAEASWALYVRLIGTTNATAFDILKIPTIGALCMLAVTTLVEARAAPGSALAPLAVGGKEAASPRRTTIR